MRKFEGFTALVTGASSGIGREIARELASLGCGLVLVARHETALRDLAGELAKTYGVKTLVLAADLSVMGAAKELHARIARTGAVIDILVNNAGSGLLTPVEFAEPSRLERMIRLNTASLTTLSALYGAEMRERRSGYILNVASVVADLPIPSELAYSATKRYVAEYTRTLRYELRRFGVGVTCLYPGGTDTGFFAAAGVPVYKGHSLMLASPQSVAKAAVKGLLRKRKRVTPGAVPKLSRLAGRLLPRRFVDFALRKWNARQAGFGSAK